MGLVLNVLLISTIVWRIYEKHHAGNSVDYRLFGALALAIIGIVLGLFILSRQKSPK
jgi:intracellular septation protein A